MPEKTIKSPKNTKPENGIKERYFEAVGRRKTAVARVRIFIRPNGDFVINEKDCRLYFPLVHQQQTIFSPLEKTKLKEKMGVMVKVFGGGFNAQAEAIRHGLARALILYKEGLKSVLKSAGYLKRDPRMVERKKFGLKKARRAPQWAKR